jgi:predicted RNA-binding protein with PIN domain
MAASEGATVIHLIVDAMNVIGSRPDGWWRDRHGALVRLARRLAALAAVHGEPITLVIDGRPIAELPAGDSGGVEVIYARRSGPNAADDRIVEYVAGRGDAPSCEVVTSDRTLGERVRALGASVRGARSLLDELDALDG